MGLVFRYIWSKTLLHYGFCREVCPPSVRRKFREKFFVQKLINNIEVGRGVNSYDRKVCANAAGDKRRRLKSRRRVIDFVGSVFSGVGQVVGNIFGHPLDFLSGKSCNSVCAPTWDFICYIENFCVAQLLKFVMVAILVYFVLLFFYLLFSLGICQCICRTLCHIIWGFFSGYFSAIHCCCSYCCLKLQSVKRNRRQRRRRRRDVEAPSSSSSSSSVGGEDEIGEMSTFRPPRNVDCKRSELSKRKRYKEEHLRKSLRPNSHRAAVELSGNSHHLHRMKNVDDHIRVTRTSKFSHKGSRHRARAHRGR